MAEFGVGIDKEKRLAEKMSRLGIREEDIVESFIRSSKIRDSDRFFVQADGKFCALSKT